MQILRKQNLPKYDLYRGEMLEAVLGKVATFETEMKSLHEKLAGYETMFEEQKEMNANLLKLNTELLKAITSSSPNLSQIPTNRANTNTTTNARTNVIEKNRTQLNEHGTVLTDEEKNRTQLNEHGTVLTDEDSIVSGTSSEGDNVMILPVQPNLKKRKSPPPGLYNQMIKSQKAASTNAPFDSWRKMSVLNFVKNTMSNRIDFVNNTANPFKLAKDKDGKNKSRIKKMLNFITETMENDTELDLWTSRVEVVRPGSGDMEKRKQEINDLALNVSQRVFKWVNTLEGRTLINGKRKENTEGSCNMGIFNNSIQNNRDDKIRKEQWLGISSNVVSCHRRRLQDKGRDPV